MSCWYTLRSVIIEQVSHVQGKSVSPEPHATQLPHLSRTLSLTLGCSSIPLTGIQTHLCAHHLTHDEQMIFIIALKVSKTDRESETDKDKSFNSGALKLKDVFVSPHPHILKYLRMINIIQ